jgi:Hus1-like protein
MMHAEEVEFYKAPDVPPPQVQLEMPNQKSVRTVVDRMKSESDFYKATTLHTVANAA